MQTWSVRPKSSLIWIYTFCPDMSVQKRVIFMVGWLYWCFTALQHFSGHFGHGQLICSHCSWASLLGSLLVLSAHSFDSNWQLPFLIQRKGENGRRNYFMTNLLERMLSGMRIEPTTVCIPGGRGSDRGFLWFIDVFQCCQFHPNGNYVATGSSDRMIRLYDILNGSCVRVLTGHKVSLN